jgi:hypothetical protein
MVFDFFYGCAALNTWGLDSFKAISVNLHEISFTIIQMMASQMGGTSAFVYKPLLAMPELLLGTRGCKPTGLHFIRKRRR